MTGQSFSTILKLPADLGSNVIRVGDEYLALDAHRRVVRLTRDGSPPPLRFRLEKAPPPADPSEAAPAFGDTALAQKQAPAEGTDEGEGEAPARAIPQADAQPPAKATGAETLKLKSARPAATASSGSLERHAAAEGARPHPDQGAVEEEQWLDELPAGDGTLIAVDDSRFLYVRDAPYEVWNLSLDGTATRLVVDESKVEGRLSVTPPENSGKLSRSLKRRSLTRAGGMYQEYVILDRHIREVGGDTSPVLMPRSYIDIIDKAGVVVSRLERREDLSGYFAGLNGGSVVLYRGGLPRDHELKPEGITSNLAFVDVTGLIEGN